VSVVEIINNLSELKYTIKTLEDYLTNKKEPEYEFALQLIKRGTCFVVVEENNNNYKFYPSRFIGYKGNSMDNHLNNDKKDGRDTNPAISNIIGHKPIPNEFLNNEYVKYCEKLGFIARNKGSFGVERKFWEL
jgi:hypothetical protein